MAASETEPYVGIPLTFRSILSARQIHATSIRYSAGRVSVTSFSFRVSRSSRTFSLMELDCSDMSTSPDHPERSIEISIQSIRDAAAVAFLSHVDSPLDLPAVAQGNPGQQKVTPLVACTAVVAVPRLIAKGH